MLSTRYNFWMDFKIYDSSLIIPILQARIMNTRQVKMKILTLTLNDAK